MPYFLADISISCFYCIDHGNETNGFLVVYLQLISIYILIIEKNARTTKKGYKT